MTIHNTHDVIRQFNIPPKDRISTSSRIGHGADGWERGDGKQARWSSFSEPDGFSTLTSGRPFVRMAVAGTVTWIAETHVGAIRAAKLKDYNGRAPSFSKPGTACPVSVNPNTGLAAVGGSRPCQRCVEPGHKVCGFHEKIEARQAAESAAVRAKWAKADADAARDEETRRRSEELVAEAVVLLGQLGIRPDTVTVSSTGLVQMPSEAFDTVLRKAAEMAEMEGMGL